MFEIWLQMDIKECVRAFLKDFIFILKIFNIACEQENMTLKKAHIISKKDIISNNKKID